MQNNITPHIKSVFNTLLKEYQSYIKNEVIAIRFLLLAKVCLIIFGIYYYTIDNLENVYNVINYIFLVFLIIFGVCVFFYLKSAKHWRHIKATLKITATKHNIDYIQLTKDFNSIAQKAYGGRGITP